MDTGSETTPTLKAAALLPLPDWADLSEPQVRGKACVWCAVILATATAVDLGTRRIRVLDGHLTTFPRACRTCMRAHALKTEAAHKATCEHCATSVDTADACDTAQAVHRLVQEHDR